MGNTRILLYGNCCQIKIRKCDRKKAFSISEMCCKVHSSTRDTGGGEMRSLTKKEEYIFHFACILFFFLCDNKHLFYNLLGELRLSAHAADREQMSERRKCVLALLVLL